MADYDRSEYPDVSDEDWAWYTGEVLPPPETPRGEPRYIPGQSEPAYYVEDAVPVPRDSPRGRQQASLIVWNEARCEYAAGETAEAICERWGLAPSTFFARAAREGWRRCDATEPRGPEPTPAAEPPAPPEPADPAQLAAQALARVGDAVSRNRPGEAGSWMRLHEKLMRAAAGPAEPRPAPEPKPAPEPTPEERAYGAALADHGEEMAGLLRDVGQVRRGGAAAKSYLARLKALQARKPRRADFTEAASEPEARMRIVETRIRDLGGMLGEMLGVLEADDADPALMADIERRADALMGDPPDGELESGSLFSDDPPSP